MAVAPWHPGDDIWIAGLGWQQLPQRTANQEKADAHIFKSAAAAAGGAALAGFIVSRARRGRK